MTDKRWVWGLLGVVLALAVGAPVLYIWAANTLFGLGLPVSAKTWTAMALMLLLFGVRVTRKT